MFDELCMWNERKEKMMRGENLDLKKSSLACTTSNKNQTKTVNDSTREDVK